MGLYVVNGKRVILCKDGYWHIDRVHDALVEARNATQAKKLLTNLTGCEAYWLDGVTVSEATTDVAMRYYGCMEML